MNKQLINKYKPEFDHWLNEGSVLINSDLGWCPIATEFAWSCNISVDTVFVINDEYSEFRKALAEGKIIQINNSKPETWIDIDTDKLANYNPSFLRIKPDEPKFKVGDFVRYIHHSPNTLALQINNINCGRYYFVNSSMSCVEHELEPWKPIKDEWCWFYDSKTNKYSHLSQFNSINNGYFKSMSINYYNFCEPFLNSKPSYLRDK